MLHVTCFVLHEIDVMDVRYVRYAMYVRRAILASNSASLIMLVNAQAKL